MRTVCAATDVQLVYLSRADVHSLAEQYAELKARLGRFASCGRGLTSKWLEHLDLTKEELHELSKHFKENVRATTTVRHHSNLEEDAYVSREFLFQHSGLTATAVAKLKALAQKRRARVQERENREVRVQLDKLIGLLCCCLLLRLCSSTAVMACIYKRACCVALPLRRVLRSSRRKWSAGEG